ncbi:uncharacterized protein LOC144885069 isoform X2 [Branchiostoma floridae x Branchiostoma japonicum]
MEATFSCPQCSFCVDHDVMLRVLKHFFNCTSFQYIMDLSCGHHTGLGHTHFPGTLKYKHVTESPSVDKAATPQTCPTQTEPTMTENELDDSSLMIPPTEIKTEPPDDTMESPDVGCTLVEPAAPPAQMMDTAGFREDCHPVRVVCAMGGGSTDDADDGLVQHETETHTITTEPVGAPSMVVTRPPAMQATRTQPSASHSNNDGGTLDSRLKKAPRVDIAGRRLLSKQELLKYVPTSPTAKSIVEVWNRLHRKVRERVEQEEWEGNGSFKPSPGTNDYEASNNERKRRLIADDDCWKDMCGLFFIPEANAFVQLNSNTVYMHIRKVVNNAKEMQRRKGLKRRGEGLSQVPMVMPLSWDYP